MNRGPGSASSDVLLASMPFGWLHGPSLGLGLLAAGLRRAGVPTRVLYFNLRFARDVGLAAYDSTMDAPVELHLGDWVFAAELFERSPSDDAAYLDFVRGYARKPAVDPSRRVPDGVVAAARAMRARAGAFLDECLDAVRALSPRLVGFSCSYHQLFASLALARRIAAEAPGTTLLLGGPACHGAPAAELARRFPFLDAVVSGEGDEVLPLLAGRALRGEPLAGIDGVHTRECEVATSTPAVRDLDALPVPEYADFFEEHAASRLPNQPCVLLETSRGCWWGERKQCAFCGLNGVRLAFRCKSPARALAEIRRLDAEHPSRDLQIVDNILPARFFRDVFPALARREGKGAFHVEIPVTLGKTQLRTLRDMRVWQVQPGVESLSTPVLRLLRKPGGLLLNVQLLKWCRELRLWALWNFLTGIPGTPRGEYARLAALVPKLVHLDPPDSMGAVVLCRHSPYFEFPGAFGLGPPRPHAAARLLFPFSEESLEALADFFECERDTAADGAGEDADPLRAACEEWRARYGAADLFFVDRGDRLALFDSRPGAAARVTALEGPDRALYLACDAVRPLGWLAALAAREGLPAAEAEARLDALEARGLMLREGDAFLALALATPPAGEYEPLLRDQAELRRAVDLPEKI